MRRKIGNFLVLVGLLMLLGAGGLAVYNLWGSYKAEVAAQNVADQLMDEIAENAADETDTDDDSNMPLYKRFPEMDMPTKEIDGYKYIGTLYFPTLDLTLPVQDDWDYTRMKISPCRYTGSVYTKDIVICGHNYISHFAPIKQLDVGDQVVFTDVSGNVFNYTVGWTEVVGPYDIEGMTTEKENAVWDMSIFTCTYGGSSRYTVRLLLDED